MRCPRFLFFASIMLAAGCDAAAPAAQPGAAGTAAAPAAPAAPALAGAGTRGGHFDLKDGAGAPLVVLFVRGSYCPLCVERLRALASYADAYGEAGARVVAVTLDPPDVAGATARALDLPVPLVSVDAATFRRWGLWPAAFPVPRPGDFVLDGAGRVRYARVGGEAADRASDVALLGILDSLRAAGALPLR